MRRGGHGPLEAVTARGSIVTEGEPGWTPGPEIDGSRAGAARASTIHTVHIGFRMTSHMPTALIDVCPLSELPPGAMRIVEWEELEIGVFNCGGDIVAIEDRCSHDNGPLAEGDWDPERCTVECPRHGSLFDLRTGKPLTLPAYVPVDTFPVVIEDGTVKLEVD
jgi:3-phenylpropionate/trans-cinnamate dioxygenase ferredoxin component